MRKMKVKKKYADRFVGKNPLITLRSLRKVKF